MPDDLKIEYKTIYHLPACSGDDVPPETVADIQSRMLRNIRQMEEGLVYKMFGYPDPYKTTIEGEIVRRALPPPVEP